MTKLLKLSLKKVSFPQINTFKKSVTFVSYLKSV